MTTQKASKPKAEGQKIKDEKVEKYFMDPFFNTLWDQYESSLIYIRDSRVQRLDSFIKVLKETRKFNEEYRNAVNGLFDEIKYFNNHIKENTSRIKFAKTDVSVQSSVNLFEETVNKFGELLSTPFKASVELIERVEEQCEQTGKYYIESLKERERVWSSLNEHYFQSLRAAQTNFNHRIEDSFNMFTSVNK
ncbi:hypothetical protein [Bacillus sp. UNCCL81]|uniref:hypothetical protein n=1 Tax=Bacillus sp. UNCCL81 TaxID=1502755 RepID=UPI0008E60F9B|nr:hypothetical protein [Bacillus sp. UNCCL81]SFC30138.1 Polyhydroxyalkanoic acid inclusion protein (PhaP_Bmeg) [Bacillus sp. UNCCL81]